MYIQNNPQSRIIQITNVPDTLFDEPIQFITDIEIGYEPGDDIGIYIFTLYTNDYKINLTKTTYIYYESKKNESILNNGEYVSLNMHTKDFFKLTVQKREKNDIINKRIYFILDNQEFACDECLDRINECRQYNNNQNQYYYEMEKEFKKLLRDISTFRMENDKLKKQINSKDQDTKNSNNSQSTPNRSIIICVLIVVLGLCIYLYFFKR